MARRAKARSAGSHAQHKRRQVAGAGGAHDVRDKLAHRIDWSVEHRPYTTLALAVGLGFVLGAVWAR